MDKEKIEDIYIYITIAIFFYAGVGMYYYYPDERIASVILFFLSLFLAWLGNNSEIYKQYRKGQKEGKEIMRDAFEREFKDKNNYLILRAKDEERQRIVNKLEGRLTDDAVLDEYYHGYIQAMLDDLK